MAIATNLGFPRIGPNRELKWALEGYWSNTSDAAVLGAVASTMRRQSWERQLAAGIEHIPSNDFSLYDHILDTAVMLGAIPARYRITQSEIDLDAYFAMARGSQGTGTSGGLKAMEMTKWFDTNYHYIVPEFEANQTFRIASLKPISEFNEAKALGIHTRPVLVGPVTFLLLGKATNYIGDRFSLLDGVLPVYEQVLQGLADAGADWVQMDEPCLGLTLDESAKRALSHAYARLGSADPRLKLLVASYFSDLRDNLETALSLPVAGLHLDLVRGPQQLEQSIPQLGNGQVLSLGVVDGRNIWRTDLDRALGQLEEAAAHLGKERIMIGPSCSMLHSPMDLEAETALDPEIRSWMAFAAQKTEEIAVLTTAVNEGRNAASQALAENRAAMLSRQRSDRAHDPAVRQNVGSLPPSMFRRRGSYPVRREAQTAALGLPEFPTTTIGSFPQTSDLRKARAGFRAGRISPADYEQTLRDEIAATVRYQEEIGLDVLVHGEAERNDMVEYFAEQLEGFTTTRHGWVQSYGSRCVKPPVLFGDVHRSAPMTVEWAKFAQALTTRPVKGMLTGPVTVLEWSFVRDDQPRSETCLQIALAIREEVHDLESSGIRVIQVDEPALREGLPLRRADWGAYLRWSVDCFRLATSNVSDETQIHTHMCYAEFNDIIQSIAELDADVISIEASRSGMELLGAFALYHYPNQVGPGVFDIHSPRVPTVGEMRDLLERASKVLAPAQLWVNPDCGLKTRRWNEVDPSLKNMIEAARSMRRGNAVLAPG